MKDLLGEEIKGRFYEQELQKVIKEDSDEYIVKSFEDGGKANWNISSSGRAMPTNSTVGLQMSTDSS